MVLDILLDDVLRREGIARDAINLLNNVRKDRGFDVSDRVRIAWACDHAEVTRALEEHAELIAREVLATAIDPLGGAPNDDEMQLGPSILRYTIERES